MNSLGNGLFAGVIIFAIQHHLDVEKWDGKKVVDLEANFLRQKYDFLLPDLRLLPDLLPEQI